MQRNQTVGTMKIRLKPSLQQQDFRAGCLLHIRLEFTLKHNFVLCFGKSKLVRKKTTCFYNMLIGF